MDKKEITTGGAPGGGGKPQLSRREREEIDKAKAKAHYQKMHAAGNFFFNLCRIYLVIVNSFSIFGQSDENRKNQLSCLFTFFSTPQNQFTLTCQIIV